MSYAIKCHQCNNKTTNPSGLCYLHEGRLSGGEPSRAAFDSDNLSASNLSASVGDGREAQANDRLADFAETELGSQFDPESLEVERLPSGKYQGAGYVEEPFIYRGVDFWSYERVNIDLETQEPTKYDPAPRDPLLDSYDEVESQRRLSEFRDTELGGQFDPNSLKIQRSDSLPKGSTGSTFQGFGVVEEPFGYRDEMFNKGDEVVIDLESQEIRKY